jgi:hypothetical protein
MRTSSPSENAWNPPESVVIECGQRAKRCRPPCSATSSGPGRNHRWYVFMISSRAPLAATSSEDSAFTLAWVATG